MDETGSSREGTTPRNDVPSLWIDPITRPGHGRQTETVRRGGLFRRANGFAFAKTREGHDPAGGSMECAAKKAADHRYDSAGLCRCGARLFESQRNRATEGED